MHELDVKIEAHKIKGWELISKLWRGVGEFTLYLC